MNEEQEIEMTIEVAAVTPTWFKWAAGAGLVWNAIGVLMFFVQMTMDLSELPEPQQVFYETIPIWATLSFAIAVFSGVLGCLALLLHKSWAVLMLQVCLVGIIVQSTHSIVLSNSIEVFGPQGVILPILTFGICALLVWLALHARRWGWIS